MNMWITLRRDVHISWIISIVCMGVVVGVIASPFVPSVYGDVWVVSIMSLLCFCVWRRQAYVIFIALIVGVFLGLWRGGNLLQTLSPYQAMVGHEVVLQGTVSEDVESGKKGETVLRLNTRHIDNHSIQGSVWVSIRDRSADIRRSDIVTVRGKMAAGFGSFVGSIYSASLEKVARPQPGDIALHVRDYFADKIRIAIKEPEASLGIGYLVGQRRSLPEELDKALQIAGLTHIVVASGYNLTILVRLARRVFMKISKFTAAFGAGGMIIAFVAISGMSPSMSRAGLVAGLSLLAWYYGRSFHPLVLLPFAAAVTLLINPAFGWNDLGWQLSFAAFVGVMIVAPLLQRYFFGEEKPGTVRQILGETIAAQVCTLPILLLAFGQLSNVALIANLLVLPLVPLAMLLTFIAGLGAMVFPFAGAFIGWPATTLLEYMTFVAQYLATLPWAQSELTMTTWIAVLFYMVIVGFCLYAWRKTKYNLREANLIE